MSNPPKYDAWQKHQEGLSLYGYDFSGAEPVLWEAYWRDTTFFAPLLKLLNYYFTVTEYEKTDSIIAYIHEKNPHLTKCGKNRFESMKIRENGDLFGAAQLEEKRYQMDSSDYAACYNAGILYIRSNHLKKGINVLKSYDPRFLNKENEISWMPGWLAYAYFKSEDYENALRVIEGYDYPKIFSLIATTHLGVLIRQKKFEELSRQLEIYQKSDVYNPGGKVSGSFFYERICFGVTSSDPEICQEIEQVTGSDRSTYS